MSPMDLIAPKPPIDVSANVGVGQNVNQKTEKALAKVEVGIGDVSTTNTAEEINNFSTPWYVTLLVFFGGVMLRPIDLYKDIRSMRDE